MSKLFHLLNPDSHEELHRSAMDVDSSTLSYHEPPLSPAGSSGIQDTSEVILARNHEPHPNCPDSLDCLPDTAVRPQHTLPVILRCAILGSPRQRLTIREIYAAMENKYSYYKTAGSTWKQSVRHHLSLNRLFERQPRPATDPGFGSYWTVNLEAPPGTKRPRKRGRNNKGPTDTETKKRGRPRKIDEAQASRDEHGHDEAEMSNYDFALDTHDEDYESDDDTMHPMDDRSSLARIQLSPYPPMPSSSSPQPLRPNTFGNRHDNPLETIERLNIEIQTLRRQSADSTHLSIRLTDQLSEAQAELSRAKIQHKRLETVLAEESRRRLESEHMASEEHRRRKNLEQELEKLKQRQCSMGVPLS